MGKRKGKGGLTRRRREEIRLRDEASQAERRDFRRAKEKEQVNRDAAVRQALRNESSKVVALSSAVLPGCVAKKNRARIQTRWDALAQAVGDVRPGLLDTPYVHGLEKLCLVDTGGRLADWAPKGRGLTAAFHSLAVHLLGGYWPHKNLLDCLLINTPDHEDSVRVARLVQAVACGQSVFSLVGTTTLPAPLTRRMCHLLVNPPGACTVEAATRRAQILAHGGREKLAQIMGEGIWGSFGRFRAETFRARALQWFCCQEILDQEKVGRMCRFLDHCHLEDAGFQMKGRTAASLFRDTEEWEDTQRELARIADQQEYATSGFTARHWDLDRRENGQDLPPDRWVLREIRNPRELVKEGSRMSNCVATYHQDVRRGGSSIWSLTRNEKPRLTIEVVNGKKLVREALGFANRDARPLERDLLRVWAKKNGLEVPVFL